MIAPWYGRSSRCLATHLSLASSRLWRVRSSGLCTACSAHVCKRWLTKARTWNNKSTSLKVRGYRLFWAKSALHTLCVCRATYVQPRRIVCVLPNEASKFGDYAFEWMLWRVAKELAICAVAVVAVRDSSKLIGPQKTALRRAMPPRGKWAA